MIRIAAAGDIHAGADSTGCIGPQFAHVHEHADLLLLAGDLTRHGAASEAAVLASELADMSIPVVAVLGNHDYHLDEHEQVRGELERVGINVLEGSTFCCDVDGVSVGVAGTKGFGGGFAGACGTRFGEPEMKAFIEHTHWVSDRLGESLASLDTDVRVALLHYAPCEQTLQGERLEIYPFLGSYLLGEAIDHAGADVVFHGHAHGGREKGVTPAGIHVRNVAQHVLGKAYAVYSLNPEGDMRGSLAAKRAGTALAG